MGILKRWKESCAEHGKELAEETARALYQITEHDGRLWFTYETFLYCPCSMMGDDEIGALAVLRKSYIDRKTKK
jgi:hypothetical protein